MSAKLATTSLKVSAAGHDGESSSRSGQFEHFSKDNFAHAGGEPGAGAVFCRVFGSSVMLNAFVDPPCENS
jgi:hypothetical protein